MGEQGWISLYRQIRSSRIWQSKEPFDKRSAWIDLLLSANHADNKIVRGNKIIEVKRGDLLTSELKLSEEWGWSRTRVRNFLKLLIEDNMISKMVNPNKFILLSILNYDRFQNSTTEKTPANGEVPGNSGDMETTEKTAKEQLKNNWRTTKKQLKNTNNNDNNIYNDNNENKKEKERPLSPSPSSMAMYFANCYKNSIQINYPNMRVPMTPEELQPWGEVFDRMKLKYKTMELTGAIENAVKHKIFNPIILEKQIDSLIEKKTRKEG